MSAFPWKEGAYFYDKFGDYSEITENRQRKTL